MKRLTELEMEKRNIMTRIRTEGTIIRAIWLNEVLPAIEEEIDRRIQAGEDLPLRVPKADEFAAGYVQRFFETNTYANQVRLLSK